jgi:hypothetical protein
MPIVIGRSHDDWFSTRDVFHPGAHVRRQFYSKCSWAMSANKNSRRKQQYSPTVSVLSVVENGKYNSEREREVYSARSRRHGAVGWVSILVEATRPFPPTVRLAGALSGDDWLFASVGSPPTIAYVGRYLATVWTRGHVGSRAFALPHTNRATTKIFRDEISQTISFPPIRVSSPNPRPTTGL